ncbi:MAG: MaoC/PaaZ C-terminal domain-containing protein [Qingshengfaniella sp.]
MARLTSALANSPLVTFAALHGACIGAGLDLALACDFRVAVLGAFFALPAVEMGILYNPGRLATLLPMLSPGAAARLLLLAERLDCAEALAGGLPPLGDYRTSREQAVLYRLTGDLHPVHVDPDVARGYGFDRPILYGLCTLGIAMRMLGPAFGQHPANLATVSARLSAPDLPGDQLTLRGAETPEGLAFDMMADDRQVLKDGFARFTT